MAYKKNDAVVERDNTTKLKNALRMLEILRKSGRMMKTSELVEALGVTSTRVINYYKSVLQYLGYNISSKAGYYGGLIYIKGEHLNEEDFSTLENFLGEKSPLLKKIKRINERVI